MSAGPDVQPKARGRGRPRSTTIDDKVLAAARAAIEARGYAATTVDDIAAAAGVAKGSIYRRWPSKGVLVYDALVRDDRLPSVIDSGNLAADLEAIASITAEGYRSPERRTLLQQIFADAARDPQLAELLRSRFFGPRSTAIATRVRAAVERGEIGADIDPALVPAVLNGAQTYWWSVWQRPMTDQEIRGLVRMIVSGGAPPVRRRPRQSS